MKSYEYNFDGLVGPTHNYAGLSFGNIASTKHQKNVSNPKEAALQGLKKMRTLAKKGFKQGVLAPQERPYIKILKRLGYSGSDAEILQKTFTDSPLLLAQVSSASCMWTANAATVSPSSDTLDGKLHFTPANLVNKFHRSIEDKTTAKVLKATFQDPNHFIHHPHLPHHENFGDEGAANHTRFCEEYGDTGLEFFVYGKEALRNDRPTPKKYPARQTYEASLAIARMHKIKEESLFLALQNPEVIDAGVFHNDVISVGNRNLLFCHEKAFYKQEETLKQLKDKYFKLTGKDLFVLTVDEKNVPVQDAVKSYLFNTQLLSLGDKKMVIIAPNECQETPTVKTELDKIQADNHNFIDSIEYFDLRQSMNNGGGPACLRLRVVLNEEEANNMNQKTILTDSLYTQLVDWVNKNYRDKLHIEDLRDTSLLNECRTALDELTQILGLGSVYDFQN